MFWPLPAIILCATATTMVEHVCVCAHMRAEVKAVKGGGAKNSVSYKAITKRVVGREAEGCKGAVHVLDNIGCHRRVKSWHRVK